MNKYKVGASGETSATNYLKDKGYVILARNYRFERNEIDIICEKKGTIVFVEVKKRSGDKFGSPIEAVTLEKTKKIMFVAQQYLISRELLDKCKARFDVIGITKDKFTHIEGAFRI